MYTVYVLRSPLLNRYYIGFTANEVETRLQEHLSKHNGFTAKAKDWSIRYTEVYPTKKEAMNRERQLKGWKSAIRIKEVIQRSSTR